MTNTRPPAVAGAFYPGSPAVLAATVDTLLAAAPPRPGSQPKALIVPHAGYVYSGSTAAQGYAALAPWRATHPPRHSARPDPPCRRSTGWRCRKASVFATPLGEIPLDRAAIAAIAGLPQIVFSDRVHAQEHSLEVHLPFLQTRARPTSRWSRSPSAMRRRRPLPRCSTACGVAPETLIVISSDLSHFLPYAAANQVDRDTCRHILELDTGIRPEQACGAYPVNGLLLAARQRGLVPQLIHRATPATRPATGSASSATRAFAFSEDAGHALILGTTLLTLARNAIAAHFGLPGAATVDLPELHETGATFVTLTQRGQLRGCIGSLEACRPLLPGRRRTTPRNAAFRDPRFAPLAQRRTAADPRRGVAADAGRADEFSRRGRRARAVAPGDRRRDLLGIRPPRDLPAAGLGTVARPAPSSWPISNRRPACPPTTGAQDVRLERYAVKKWKEEQL